MMEVKRCCIFFSPKTGTIILGTLGVIVITLYLIPQTLVLKNHDYHMNQFVKEQRLDGGQFTISQCGSRIRNDMKFSKDFRTAMGTPLSRAPK